MGFSFKKGHWAKILLVLLLAVLSLVAIWLLKDDYLSLDHIKDHREQLLVFVHSHYLESVFIFICLCLVTALCLPGALALTIAGGMMFDMVPAAIYVNIGTTIGAALAFLAARFVIGGWIQERFQEKMDRLNRELAQHGHSYLLVLRVLPIFPHFVVNYGAGITRIPLRTFVWTTSVGMIPGSLIYTFIGEELRSVNAAKDLLSPGIILALVLISLLILAPVIIHHLQNRKR